ncbi:MAG TPA: hypothetical protein VD791_11530 [Burkholderiales bacterium]|nr:hypothetical protein [Burkholderiales bacterium]
MTTALASFRSLAGAILLAVAPAALAAEPVPPPPPIPAGDTAPAAAPAATDVKGKCVNCGVVRSIRAVERERKASREVPAYMTSDQYLNTRRYSEPRVGPVFGLTFGPGQETKSFVGAAGNEAMRQRMLEIVYEIVVLYDDGRFGLIEQPDRGALRVGDRVRVVDDRVELAPRE